jgi:hypothetical protein
LLVIESPKIDKGLSIAGTVPPVLAGAFDPVVVLGLVVVAVEDPPLLFAGLGIVVVGPPTADAAALNTLLGVVPFISATPSSGLQVLWQRTKKDEEDITDLELSRHI